MKVKKILLFLNESNQINDNEKKRLLKNLRNYFKKIIFFKPEFYTKLSNNRNIKILSKKIIKKYNQQGININEKNILKIDSYLNSLKYKFSNLLISSNYVRGALSEKEIIFFELSKYYNFKFLRIERSPLKNRYSLAKNIYKHSIELSKKKIQNNQLEVYIKFYKKFIDLHREIVKKIPGTNTIKSIIVEIYYYLYKIFNRLEIKDSIDDKNNYILVIIPNDYNLLNISLPNLKSFLEELISSSNKKVVFLLHPRLRLGFFLRRLVKVYKVENLIKKNKNRFIFIPKIKKISKLILESSFIVHISSSLSIQALFFDKNILCIGKKNIYIEKPYKNILFYNLNKQKKIPFSYLEKKKICKNYLNYLLVNSVDYYGEFYSNKFILNKKSFLLDVAKHPDKTRIIISLLKRYSNYN